MNFVNIYLSYNGNAKNHELIAHDGIGGVDYSIKRVFGSTPLILPVSIFKDTALLEPPIPQKNMLSDDYITYASLFLKEEIEFFKEAKSETGLNRLILSTDQEQGLQQKLLEEFISKNKEFKPFINDFYTDL